MNLKISHCRGFEIPKVFLIVVFLFIFLTPACNPEDILPPEKANSVATSKDPSVSFSDLHTYYMSDTVWEINNTNDEALPGSLRDSIYVTIDSAITKKMRGYGYKRVNKTNPNVPDIRISTAIINNGSPIGSWYPHFPGWGWGTHWEEWLASSLKSKGIDGISVKLDSAQVISYGDNGLPRGSSPVIFVAQAANQDITKKVKYKFKVDGIPKQDDSPNKYTLRLTEFPSIGESKTISVILTEDGKPVASDSVKIYGVQHGSLDITAFLTNASHVVPADSVGNVADSSYENCGGRFKVFVGDSLVSQKIHFYIANSSKIKVTIDSLGFYKINNMDTDADVGTATFVVNDSIKRKLPNNKDTSLLVNYTLPYKIYKSKKFYAGLPGYYKEDFWNSLYESTYPPRTILIEMADPKKMEFVNGRFVTPIYWAANIYGAIQNKASFSDTTRIRAAIDTAFIQSPYLNNSK